MADDQNTMRLWSNEQLNAWLKQCLATERETVRQLTSKGMTASLEKNNEDVAELFIRAEKRILALEAEVAAIKAKQKKWGFFS